MEKVMTPRLKIVIAFLGIIYPFQALNSAEISRPGSSKVKALIAQLGARDFGTRESATSALRAMGAPIAKQLRAARAQAAGAEQQYRLENLLFGPVVYGKSLSAWSQAFRSEERDHVSAVKAFEKAGPAALLHLPAMLTHRDPVVRQAGLWLAAKQGPRVGPLRAVLTGILKRTVEKPLEEAARSGDSEPWTIYVQGVETRVTRVPWAHFYLGSRADEAFTGLEEVGERIRFSAMNEIDHCRVQAFKTPRATEVTSLLWGVWQALEFARRAGIEHLEVAADLRVRMLCRVLERVGLDAEAKAAIARARLKLAAGPQPRAPKLIARR